MYSNFLSDNELSEISEKKEFQRPVVKTEFVGYIDKWNEKISVHDEVFYPYGDLFLVNNGEVFIVQNGFFNPKFPISAGDIRSFSEGYLWGMGKLGYEEIEVESLRTTCKKQGIYDSKRFSEAIRHTPIFKIWVDSRTMREYCSLTRFGTYSAECSLNAIQAYPGGCTGEYIKKLVISGIKYKGLSR